MINDYFDLREFVDQETWNQFGEKSIWFIDQRLIDGVTLIRKEMQRPITINNWHKLGKFEYRGLRPKNCSVGAENSQHKYGRAVDISVLGMTTGQVYQWVANNWTTLGINKYFTTIENIQYTKTWLHLDCRNTGDTYPLSPLIVTP